MGGHAFPNLHTPRISKELYFKVRGDVTKALKRLFTHVVVPTEMPSKKDYGDVDFLVAGPMDFPSRYFNYHIQVKKIKAALNTTEGRKGWLTPNVMYFAVPTPGREDDSWIQIDVKVCEKPGNFEWEKFQLNYASGAKMIGSMIKPLGLTIDPEGLHVRVEGLDTVNFEKSCVPLTKEPKEVLKIVGVDRRLLDAGFRENEELFEYLTGSWLFNPAHFAERLKDEKFLHHLEERSAPYVAFVKTWIPERYPNYTFSSSQTSGIDQWYRDTRVAVREKVLSMYPSKAVEYYEKRSEYIQEVEEHRLRDLLIAAIPIGTEGWSEEFPQPQVIIKPSINVPHTPQLKPITTLNPIVLDTPLTISTTAATEPIFDTFSSSTSPSSTQSDKINFPRRDALSTPLILDKLPHQVPAGQEFTPRPPPQSMSLEAKLLCVARWTLFSPSGIPYLAHSPREKKFETTWMWTDTGAGEQELVKWAKEMWWAIWTRQFRVNYVGMWKNRMEMEDVKKEKDMREKVEKHKMEEEVRERRAKIMRRLKNINEGMGMADDGNVEVMGKPDTHVCVES